MESSNRAASGEQSTASDAAEQQLLRQEAQNLEDIAATFRYMFYYIFVVLNSNESKQDSASTTGT